MAETAGVIRLLLCPLAEALPLAEQYHPLLDEREQAHLGGLGRAPARQRYLVGRALLRHGLAEVLARAPDELAFAIGPQGKPRLVDDACYFNLSHSHDWLVLAISQAGPVGVDIEFHGRRNRIDKLARYYFSPAEQLRLGELPEPERRAYFFMLWTLREAYAKALGCSLWDTLAGTRIDWPEGGVPELHLSGRACHGYGVRWWHLNPLPDYSLALAGLGEGHRLARVQAAEMIPGQVARPFAPSRTGAVSGWCEGCQGNDD